MNRHLTVFDTSGRDTYPPAALESLDGLDVRVESCSAGPETNWTAACREADALLVTGARIGRSELQAMPRLRGIVRYGVGLDRIDLQAARERGVQVRNVRGFCIDEMADHTLCLLLALSRDLVSANARAKAGVWDPGPRKLHRLRGQTLGIVGVGDIGRAVAVRARACGLKLLAFDPYAGQTNTPADIRLAGDLPTLLRESDWVSLHCPLTPQTRRLIDADALAAMKSSAGLINTARGEIVDEAALTAALETGQIAAAGLDVLNQEPPPSNHPLLNMENVIVSPHVAWYSESAHHDVVVGAFRQLAHLLRPEH